MDKSVYTATSNIAKSYELWSKKNDGVANSMKQTEKKVDRLKQQMSLFDNEIKKSEKTLGDIKKQFGENSSEVEEYKSHLLDLKLSHANLSEEVRNSERQLNTFSGKLDLLGKEFEKIDKKYEVFNRVGGSLNSLGNKLTLGVTMPLAAAGTASAKFAMEFEKGVAKVSTIADTTKASMDELKSGVINLSNKTAMSTNDLNEALYQAISASVDTGSAVDFLDTAVKASVGGFTDTTTAVNGLTTVLNSYGLEAGEVDKIANQMLITQNAGKTSFGELASTVGKVTPVASALGIKTEELFSSLAVTTAQGLATAESVTALKAAMSNIIKPTKEAGEAAESLGINFNVSNLQSQGWIPFLKDLKEGLQNASPHFDEISRKYDENAIKLIELEKAGQKGSEAYKNLTKENKNLTKELETMAQAADSEVGAMATMFGSVEGLNSILMLTSEQGMSKYNDTMKQMETNTGALDDAYNKMTDTTEFKLKKSLNSLKNTSMELGVKLLPLVEKGIKLLENLIDKFNNLSPSTQEWILKIGIASMTLGPLLKIVGGTVSGVGNLASGIEKLGTTFGIFRGASTAATLTGRLGQAAGVASGAGGLGGLSFSLSGVVLAAAPYVLAAGAIAGAGYGIYKGLTKEVIPSVDLFADEVTRTSKTVSTQYGAMTSNVQVDTVKISEATEKAVQSYLDLDEKAKSHLTDLYINSTVITEETCNGLIEKYREMGDVISTNLESDKQKDLETLSKFFKDSEVLSAESEDETLRIMQEGYENKKGEVRQKEDEIRQLIATAKEQNRALKEEEVNQINLLQNKMRDQAIRTLSEQEKEANVILDRLAAYDNRVTAEQAGKHIATLNDQRDKAVDAANTECRERVATIERMRDELGVISGEQAEKLIKDAENQRDKIIDSAKETRDKAVEKIFDMNRKLRGNVSESTGEIMSWWDQMLYKWNNFNPEPKQFKYSVSGYVEKMGGSTQYATGTSAMGLTRGVRTTMNERGYELYNLPRGSRIYNNQASEALITKTATRIAEGLLLENKAMINEFRNITSNGNSTQIDYDLLSNKFAEAVATEFDARNINRPLVELDGNLVGKAITPIVSSEFAFRGKGRR